MSAHPQGAGTALAPQILHSFQKSSTHLALDDVRESIRELQFYRERLLRQF